MKLIDILNEERYLVNIKYTVDSGWYRNPIEALKTDLHFERNIISFKIKKTEIVDDNFIAYVKLICKVDKRTMQKILNDASTRAEEYKVL